MRTPLETVNAFLESTSSHGEDLERAADLMTEDVRFSGPLMALAGRDAYVALLRQFVPAHVGGSLTIPMSEWFRLREGRIAEHRIFYDPRGFAAAFGIAE